MTSLQTKVKYVCKGDIQSYIKRLKTSLSKKGLETESKEYAELFALYREDLDIGGRYKIISKICWGLVERGEAEEEILSALVMTLDHNHEYLAILMLSSIIGTTEWEKMLSRCREKFQMNLFMQKTIPIGFEDFMSYFPGLKANAKDYIEDYYAMLVKIYRSQNKLFREIAKLVSSHPAKSKMHYVEFLDFIALSSSGKVFLPKELERMVGPHNNLVQLLGRKGEIEYEYDLLSKKFTENSLIKVHPNPMVELLISEHVRVFASHAVWHPFVYEQPNLLKEEKTEDKTDYKISFDLDPYFHGSKKGELPFNPQSQEDKMHAIAFSCMFTFNAEGAIDPKLLTNLLMILDHLKDYVSIISIYRYPFMRSLWDATISESRKRYSMNLFKEARFTLALDSSLALRIHMAAKDKAAAVSGVAEVVSQFYDNSRDKYKGTANYAELHDRIPGQPEPGFYIMHFPDFIKLIIKHFELGERKDAQFPAHPSDGVIQIYKEKSSYVYEYDIALRIPSPGSKVQAQLPVRLLSILIRHSRSAGSGAICWYPYVYTKCNLCSKSATNLCSSCLQAYYCNAECQKKDYKAHKKSCKKPGGK